MANDRLLMRCRYCKKTIVLSKYYPNIISSFKDAKEGVENFIDRHFKCSPNIGLDLDGDRCFDLLTESGCTPEEWQNIKWDKE